MMTHKLNLSPIVIFVYNRPLHLKNTVESLKNNVYADQSDLIIYSDAAKKIEDISNVKLVRSFIHKISGFKTITIIERKINYGLSKSIIKGVTEIINKYGKVIVLEDDMETSKYFLKYMNEALEIYKNETSVISIHGYIYPVNTILPDTFFLHGADCWGWATWKRGWDLFEVDGTRLRQALLRQKLVSELNWQGSMNYLQMLDDHIAGRNDSWAIRWLASAAVNRKFTLYPGTSLVKNIGLDGSGTHCQSDTTYNSPLVDKPIKIIKQSVEENALAKKAFQSFFNSNKSDIYRQIFTYITNIYQKISSKPQFGWFGNYDSWQAALKDSSGYQTDSILNKTMKAMDALKMGLSVYERDSVLFDQIEYSWPVLSALLWSAARNNGALNIIDYGGALGTTYFQNKKFFRGLKDVKWNIVEQSHYVQIGQSKYSDHQLEFFYTLSDCLKKNKSKTILLSSVLQYLEKPYEFIKQVINLNFDLIIIDRTSFIKDLNRDRLTIQIVNPKIYQASYPCWFFDEHRFLNMFKDHYDLIESFTALDIANIKSEFKGFIFLRKHK